MDITAIIAWIVILILAWVFIKPYVLTFVISKKNRAGIPTNLSPEQILTLLENHPWCEDQNIRAEAADIPGTQIQSQIRLNGICSEFYLYTKDGLLHGHGFTTRKVEKLRRLYLVQKETQRLLQYITCQADPDAPENEAAAQLREENRKAILRRDRYDKFDKLCYLLAALAVIVLVVLHFIPFKDYSPSANIKGTVFSDFHYTETIGAALASFDPDGEWYDISEKNALKEDGVAYAGWRGTCLMSNLLYGSSNQTIESDFKVEQADKEQIHISLDKIQFMDQYYFSSGNTFQSAVMYDILDMIYGNTQYAEVSLDVGLLSPAFTVTPKDPSVALEPDAPTQPAVDKGSTAAIPEPEPEVEPETEVPAALPSAVGGEYDDFVGTWQDENGNGLYLFIGYGDETKQQAYAYVSTAAADFEAELTTVEDGVTSGVVMEGGASEPTYAIDILRNKYWLETIIYYGELGFEDYIKFVPADPETCPENPYYLD